MYHPDVLFLSMLPWEPRYQRPHHVALGLAGRGCRVTYVSPQLAPGSPGWSDQGDPAEGIRTAKVGSAARPYALSHPFPWAAEDRAATATSLEMLINDHALRCPLVFVNAPAWSPPLADLLRRMRLPVIYDCLDEHTGWDVEAASWLRRWEDELLHASQLVLAASAVLERRLRRKVRNVLHVPNGCDVDHFATALRHSGILRNRLSPPIVGFFGAAGVAWFDTALVVAVAAARPQWSIALVGPIEDRVGELLSGVPNIHTLGEVSYEDLPRYCGDFDVAIIPWLLNELTEATDPVKVWEYLASGKDVVATPLPELFPLQGAVQLAETPEATVGAVERVLEKGADEKGADAERAVAVARSATWSRRVDSFFDEMCACLPTVDVVVRLPPGRPRAVVVEMVRSDGFPCQILEGSDLAPSAILGQRGRFTLVVHEGPPPPLADAVHALVSQPATREVDFCTATLARTMPS